MQGVKRLVTGEEPTMAEEFNAACTMSKKTRMICFGICFATGCVLSFISSFLIFQPVKFAIVYSLGNLTALGSSAFLVGPLRQVKLMFDETRRIAAGIYLVLLFTTLIYACAAPSPSTILVIVLVIAEAIALIWYCLSYIPFARAAVLKCLGRAIPSSGN